MRAAPDTYERSLAQLRATIVALLAQRHRHGRNQWLARQRPVARPADAQGGGLRAARGGRVRVEAVLLALAELVELDLLNDSPEDNE